MKPAVLAILAVAASLLVVRCTTPEATLRFRMTVELDTPNGRKSGSSIMKLVLARKFLIPLPGAGGSDYGGRYWVYGEAPYVDMGNGNVLFTIRDGGTGQEIRGAVLSGIGVYRLRTEIPRAGDAAILNKLNASKPSNELSRGDYLTFARFTNVDDPKSLVKISPDDLNASLGQGYALKKIVIQVVDKSEPLTTSLAMRFPALAKFGNVLTSYE